MPDLELIILGTSSPIHSSHRFGNSQVIQGGDSSIMIDAGWGTTLRLFQAQIRLPTIDAVFFTHLHSDHITDFADFMVMRWVTGIREPLPVYGPAGTKRMIEGFQQILEADTGFRIAHHGDKLDPRGPHCGVTEIDAGDDPVEIARVGDITVSAFAVDHRPVIPAYGFRVERNGKTIAISGDTNYCAGLVNGARDADLFVCDALNKEMMTRFEEAIRNADGAIPAANLEDAHSYHGSPTDAATAAREANAKHLVLTHLMPPIPEEGPQVDEFIKGIPDIYDGPLTIAKDLMRLSV